MGLLPKSSNKSIKKVLVSGQALLIVLLSMSVVLAVVLSSVSKSVTDISITNYEEESLRAFSAAEAGIEEALIESVVPGDIIPETKLDPSDPADPKYEAEVGNPEAGTSFEYPDKLDAGEVATFWFVSHNNNGNLTCSDGTCAAPRNLEFCWTSDGAVNPSIEVAVYYDVSRQSFLLNDFSGLQVRRFNFSPQPPIQSGRNFEAASTSCNIGSQYKYSTGTYLNKFGDLTADCVEKNATNCLIAARVRILDNTTGEKLALRISGGGKETLPSQGILISSTGSVGESTRNVTVLQGYPEPPDVFEGVLFSGRELSQ
jgi:hypothetical protein